MGNEIGACEISTWTTGAGIVIGTNIDVYGYFMGAAATTLTLKCDSATMFVASSALYAAFLVPVATNGAITGTSSGGSFSIMFRKRAR